MSRETEAYRGQEVQEDPQEEAYLDLQVPRVHLDHVVLQDYQVEDLWVIQAIQDLAFQDLLEFPGAMEIQALQALLDQEAHRDNQDGREHQEYQVPKVNPVLWESRGLQG